MKYLKCFKNQINIVLSLSIFVLGVIAIVLGFCNELFGCEFIKEPGKYYPQQLTNLKWFDIRTEGTSTFTLQGILEFTSRLVENANLRFDDKFSITPELVNAASAMKVLVIILFVFFGVFAVGSLFDFKKYSNIVSSLVCLVLTIVIRSIAVNTFYDVNMINIITKTNNALVVLWSVALFISLLQLAFNLYVKYLNKAEK